jgi:hypothetical protein
MTGCQRAHCLEFELEGGGGASVAAVVTRSRTATAGSPAPDFDLTGPDGVRFHLAEALATGPVVVVFLRGFA